MSQATGKFMADLVKWFHFVWVLLAIGALPIVIFAPAARVVVIVAFAAMLLAWIVTRDCPLRSVEQYLRRRFHRDGVYMEGFLHHHFGKPLGLRPNITLVISVVYAVVILGIGIFA